MSAARSLQMSEVFPRHEASATAEMCRALRAIYPGEMSADSLSRHMRIAHCGDWFAAVCWNFHRANEALAPYGWQVVRSGGRPHDTYALKRTAGSGSMARQAQA